MSYDAIPEELKALRQWICWKKEVRDGKETKVPINARIRIDLDANPPRADTTDPETWTTFRTAVKRSEAYDGIGFVFTKDDPYVGIDLDDGFNELPTEGLPQFALPFDTYAEWSPSQKGVHIIGKGDLPTEKSGRRSKGMEVYHHSRFFTMTGNPIEHANSHVMDIQPLINTWWTEWFPEKKTVSERPPVTWHAEDDDILQRLATSKNGTKFTDLYTWGDLSPYGGNASEADLALCSLMTFYTQDAAQIDRLFRASRLYRDKWEREDYREATISAALERSEFYTPPGNTASGITMYRSGWFDADKPFDKTFVNEETGEILDVKSESREILTFNMTDKGNARRLVHHASDRLRYVPKWNTWLVWDGTRWAPDALGSAMEVAKEVAETIYTEADAIPNEDQAKKMRAWAVVSESASRLRDMLKLAQSDPAISVSPASLDRDIMLLNVKNGTIDLRTGELRPHVPADMLTKLAPVDYDPDAKCPAWESFLAEIMARRESLVEYLQRAAGYTLSGDVSERKMFILHGGGRNGKSTFLDTLYELMGDYAKRSPNDILIARYGDRGIPHETAALVGVRFTFVSETGEFDRMDESKVKDLVSGDPIAARLLHQNLFEFRPHFKLWAGTNHKPTVRSSDDAIWDRTNLIPFDVKIPVEQVDRHLPDKLRKEYAGILAWAVRGCLEWQKVGMEAPEIVRQETEDYRESMDVVGSFIREECITRGGANESVASMYNAYKEWAEANGEKPMTKKALSMRMTERGYASKRMGHNNVYTYQDIRLRTTMDGDDAYDTPSWATLEDEV